MIETYKYLESNKDNQRIYYLQNFDVDNTFTIELLCSLYNDIIKNYEDCTIHDKFLSKCLKIVINFVIDISVY